MPAQAWQPSLSRLDAYLGIMQVRDAHHGRQFFTHEKVNISKKIKNHADENVYSAGYPGCTVVGLARADHWSGPYSIVGGPAIPFQMEDFYLYKTARGFHALFHGMDPWPGDITGGRHAYSEDGITWFEALPFLVFSTPPPPGESTSPDAFQVRGRGRRVQRHRAGGRWADDRADPSGAA